MITDIFTVYMYFGLLFYLIKMSGLLLVFIV